MLKILYFKSKDAILAIIYFFLDELLVLFFHSCYFKMEPTKITIDNYFSCRTHVPEFFTDRDPFKTDLVKGKPVV